MAPNEVFISKLQASSYFLHRFIKNEFQLSASLRNSVCIAAIAVIWFCAAPLFSFKRPRIKGAQVHGSRGWWEPLFMLRTRFIYDAHSIIKSGYDMHRHKPFVLTRYDTDIHVMPMAYLDELRLVSRKRLNGKLVHYNNLFRTWSWASVIRDSDLHVTVLTRKLNPEVGRYIDIAFDEFKNAWDTYIPDVPTWTEVDIQYVIRMLVARMSARVFVGQPICRDPEWLDMTINFSIDLFIASFTLRMFPPWTHFFVKPFIPARRRVQQQIATGTKVIREHLYKREMDGQSNESERTETLFDWMIDHAVGEEGSLEQMSARQCILTLASIHTTATTVANILFDMIANPEWFEVLREEIDDTLKQHGAPGESLQVKTWLQHLEKMDSFILESQRMNPAILLTPQRIALQPITLKDGTLIPKGARIAWPGPQHALDPSNTPNPQVFDPLRNYRKRHAGNLENIQKFMAGQSDPDNMSFGYGSQVCPGRYFAVGEIKLVLMRMLQEFDFASPKGMGKPRTFYADENVILDPSAKVLMKRRDTL